MTHPSTQRIVGALPVLIAIVLLAAGGSPLVWPAAFAVIVLASIALAHRFELTTFGALLWMIAGGTPAILWARVTTMEIGLALPVTLTLLGVVVVRAFFDAPLFGRGFDRALVGFACIAEGMGVKSAVYPWGAVLLALAILVEQAGGVVAVRAFARTPRATFAFAILALALGAAGVVALPALDRAANRRFQSLYEGRIRRTAFSAHVRLDQPGLINQNEEIVLRLRGAETDHLRGAVFDQFDGSYWTTSHRRSPGAPLTPANDDVTWVESAEASSWLFAPRGAKIVSETAYNLDALGAVRPADPRGATQWAFASTAERDDPPTDDDLQLPAAVAEDVRALALAWTADAPDDRARVQALARHLTSDFTYTLDRAAPAPGVAPLHDFLFVHREGHCEFFASAFVVLARALRIPARLVAGFRVVEHNGFGGYAVVRAKHAHAWAELFVPRADGGGSHFETFDATPPGVESLEEMDSRTAAAFFDWAKWELRAAYDAAFASPERSIPVLVGIIAIALIVRALRNRRARRGDGVDDVLLVPAAFVRFEAKLGAAGFVRKPSETLEELATRLDTAGRAAWARSLRRYAEARYGPGTFHDAEVESLLEAE